MSKKVLLLTSMKQNAPFIGSKPETDMRTGSDRLNALDSDIQFTFAAISELIIQVRDGQVSIYDTRNECDLTTYDLVQLRITSFARDHYQAVAFYLAHHNIPYIDAKDAEGTFYGKLSQMVAFALAGVRVPDTIGAWNADIYRKAIRDTMTLPFIFKDNHGSKGNRNFLVTDWEMLARIQAEYPTESFVAQPFIANDGDYRVLMLGSQRIAIYRQRQTESHLNNTSQGGQGRMLTDDECPDSVLTVALQAAISYGRKIAGVDVLVERDTGQAYVLEANDTPALLAGQFKEEKAAAYLRFIEEELTQRER